MSGNMYNNNNIPRIISQVGFEKGSAYTDLTPILEGREVISHTPSAQEKT